MDAGDLDVYRVSRDGTDDLDRCLSQFVSQMTSAAADASRLDSIAVRSRREVAAILHRAGRLMRRYSAAIRDLQATLATSPDDVAGLAPVGPFSARWDGIEGLHVAGIGVAPVVAGQTVLSLAALQREGRHRLGLAFAGLPHGRVCRISAWVKRETASRASVEVRDGVSKKSGIVTFDLATRKVISSPGASLPGNVEDGPAGWLRLSTWLETTDGCLVVYLGIADAAEVLGEEEVLPTLTFGGFEISPDGDQEVGVPANETARWRWVQPRGISTDFRAPSSRYEIAPQMEDYDRLMLGARWLPYIMRFHKESVRLASVSTDAHGFRVTTGVDGARPLRLEDWRNPARRDPQGVLLGSSAAFGWGATHDRHTIASVLSRSTSTPWLNFGGAGFNSTQELLLLILHLPRHIDKLVVFSGINNLALSHLTSRASPVYTPLFDQSRFEHTINAQPNTDPGVRASLRLLVRAVQRKATAQNSSFAEQFHKNNEAQYAHILSCFARDLEILRMLGDARRFQVYFALQPAAFWVQRALAPQEEELFAILDEWQPTHATLWRHIAGQRDKYLADLRRICAQNGVQFLDLNASAKFRVKEWLFVDRVHLTDRGYAVAAEVLREAFGL